MERELEMRRRVYGSWVKSGRMKQEAADYELAAMAAVQETVRAAMQDEKMTSKLTGKRIDSPNLVLLDLLNHVRETKPGFDEVLVKVRDLMGIKPE